MMGPIALIFLSQGRTPSPSFLVSAKRRLGQSGSMSSISMDRVAVPIRRRSLCRYRTRPPRPRVPEVGDDGRDAAVFLGWARGSTLGTCFSKATLLQHKGRYHSRDRPIWVKGLSVARPATGGNRETRAGAIEAGRSSVCVCDCAPLLAFGAGLGGEADKFLGAIGEGGEVEAIGSTMRPVGRGGRSACRWGCRGRRRRRPRTARG